jgi:hypothetical protein
MEPRPSLLGAAYPAACPAPRPGFRPLPPWLVIGGARTSGPASRTGPAPWRERALAGRGGWFGCAEELRRPRARAQVRAPARGPGGSGTAAICLRAELGGRGQLRTALRLGAQAAAGGWGCGWDAVSCGVGCSWRVEASWGRAGVGAPGVGVVGLGGVFGLPREGSEGAGQG